MDVGVTFGVMNMASYGRSDPSLGLKFNSCQFTPSKNSYSSGEAEIEREKERERERVRVSVG